MVTEYKNQGINIPTEKVFNQSDDKKLSKRKQNKNTIPETENSESESSDSDYDSDSDYNVEKEIGNDRKVKKQNGFEIVKNDGKLV